MLEHSRLVGCQQNSSAKHFTSRKTKTRDACGLLLRKNRPNKPHNFSNWRNWHQVTGPNRYQSLGRYWCSLNSKNAHKTPARVSQVTSWLKKKAQAIVDRCHRHGEICSSCALAIECHFPRSCNHYQLRAKGARDKAVRTSLGKTGPAYCVRVHWRSPPRQGTKNQRVWVLKKRGPPKDV